MTTIERKQYIIESISKITDENIIEGVYRFLHLETEVEEIQTLSEAQKQILAESDKQIDDGNYITHEALNAKIEEWLNA